MKKVFAAVLAVMMMLSLQIVQAADGTNDEELGQPATPIESSKVYPKDIEKGLKYNGTVVISATVSTEGKVIKTVVMRSAGRPMPWRRRQSGSSSLQLTSTATLLKIGI